MISEPVRVLVLMNAYAEPAAILGESIAVSEIENFDDDNFKKTFRQINQPGDGIEFVAEFVDIARVLRENALNSPKEFTRVKAFSHLAIHRFDMIVMDFSSQSLPDEEFITQINLIAFNIPIIVLGFYQHEVIRSKIFACGAQEYLVTSDLDVSTLRDRLFSVYERSRWQQNPPMVAKPESHFRAIFERSPMGIALIDMTGHLVEVNPALCKLLSYERNDLFGKRFTDLISCAPGDLEVYQQLMSYPLERLEMERRLICEDGSLIWVNLNLSLIPDGNGEPAYYLAMIEDISDRKQGEFRLRETKEAAEAGNRAKSEFLATMSHELRTPLHAIMGLSQLLLQQMVGTLNDKQLEYINCIYSSGEHLLALINDILDLSKVEAGKEELLLQPIPLIDICNYAIYTVRDRAANKGLKLVLQINTDIENCIADERRLKQMLLNLLTNAIKFTAAGEVKLVVENSGNNLHFHVVDTGIGIDVNSFQFLFEPFTQLDSNLNRQYEGTGLGLALTRKLARLHGGDVIVESTPQIGSIFTLILPHCDLEEARLRTRHQANTFNHELGYQNKGGYESNYFTDNSQNLSYPQIETKRIFLVEDDENTATLLKDYLETIGYLVEVSNDGEDFLSRVRKFDADLILLDIHLASSISGMDLLQELRQQPDLDYLPVVVVTPTAISKRQDFLYAGANDVLSKPIGIVQLESILARYLG